MAEAMEVGVQFEEYLPNGWAGAFSAVNMVIYLLKGLPRPKSRVVLAHELGHAHYGHRGRGTMAEWQADVFAAKTLINRVDYLEAVRVTGGDVEETARLLNVTPHLLRVAGRAARGPSNFQFQQVKLSAGLPTQQLRPDRPVEPRRLTTAIPLVPTA